MVMAAVIKIGGGFHPGAMKLVMTLMAFPFVLLPGLYFSRTQGRAMGLAVMLVLTVGHAMAAFEPRSTLGFASLVWAVIILLDAPSTFTWPRVFAWFCLASFAIAYRFAGVALVPAIALFALANYRRHGFRPAWMKCNLKK